MILISIYLVMIAITTAYGMCIVDKCNMFSDTDSWHKGSWIWFAIISDIWPFGLPYFIYKHVTHKEERQWQQDEDRTDV